MISYIAYSHYSFQRDLLISYIAFDMLISHNRIMATWPHGHDEKQCPRKSVYILLLALQLLFSRFVSFRAIASFFRATKPLSTS